MDTPRGGKSSAESIFNCGTQSWLALVARTYAPAELGVLMPEVLAPGLFASGLPAPLPTAL
jgi:hypothetical protein